jgi:peptide/nickel transport system ATP-binding protein
MTALVQVRGLSKDYRLPRPSLLAARPVRPALRAVDLDVAEGQTHALIGESGSGKSTLVRLLLALDRPTAGTVQVAGQPVGPGPAGRLRWLRRATGIVLQDPYASLDPRFTIGRSIAEPLEALAIPGDHRRLVAEVLERVGLPADGAGQYPHELSGGQRQRVALARAIVHRPRLLVGDEPMSALDVTVRAQVLTLLAELRADLGLTILLVSHDIGLVQHIADQITVLQDGAVVETGPAAQVLGAPSQPYTARLLAAVPTLIERTP